MSKWNLSDGLEDHFNFEVTLKGKQHKYSMKYPSTKELNPIRLGYSRLEKLGQDFEKTEDEKEKKKIEEELEEVSTKIADAFTVLFTAEEGSMHIAELLEELPSNVRAKFDNMIQTELGVDKG